MQRIACINNPKVIKAILDCMASKAQLP